LHPTRKRLADYLIREGYPLYSGTQAHYFSSGEATYVQLLIDLEKAEKFIFLAYYMLADGVIWSQIHDILKRKAALGLEIRVMYDAFGSAFCVPRGLKKQLKSESIKIKVFNPMLKYIFRLYFNYRNHQKICIIDGNIGYTGGVNIGDEYANLYPLHGYWKDCAVKLAGEAVLSLTTTFLSMWEACGEKTNYTEFFPAIKKEGHGFFIPFADGPANNPDNSAEVIYRQIINTAKEYVYITTPYLIVQYDMLDALCTAAQSGIDVKIITPGVPDHLYVHMVTTSDYLRLMEAGVQIYEYAPGFIHAKIILSDDDNAILGSINMDFRSFNMLYENGVWICGAPIIKDIKDDFENTLKFSKQIDLVKWKERKWYIKCLQTFLKIFAPLM